MNLVFCLAVSLLLPALQSLAAPLLGCPWGTWDLFMPFVFFLAVFLRGRQALPAVLVLGVLADTLSAAPFGIHVTAFLWFFAIIKWGLTFLHVRTRVFLPMLMGLGILIRDMLFLICLWASGNMLFSKPVGLALVRHFLWNALIGPIVFLLLNFVYQKWHHLTCRLFPEKSESG